MLTYLFWPLFCAALALGQGLLLPTLRQVPATSPDARRNNAALHGVLALAYCLPLLLAPATWPEALGARLLCFDVAINLASGRPVFYVGQTAAADRLLQRLALGLHCAASTVRLVGWVACLAGVIGWLIFAYMLVC